MEAEEKATNANLRFNVKIAFRYSLILAACFMVVFIIASVTGLVKIIQLRFLNYVFTYIFTYLALGKVYNAGKYVDVYFTGFRLCIFIASLGQFWFSFFLLFYLNINTELTNYLNSQVPWNIVMPRFSLVLLFFAEGVGISSILSLAVVQHFEWKKGIR